MGLVRTVLGDIDSGKLGYTLPHEHIFIDVNGHGQPDCPWSMYDWNIQRDMVLEFKANGGGTLVDANPLTSDGRDVARLKVMAECTGVNIVACTGFVKDNDKTGNTRHLVGRSVEEVTDFFVKEIEEGIDGTDIRAGWIKGASLYYRISPIQELCMRAGARASMKTGVPMHTHTEIGTYCLEQVKMVEEEGMDLTHFGLAHVDRNPDFWLHKKLAERGCYLIYDGPGKAKYYPDSMRIDILKRLCDAGYEKQIMLCNDLGKREHHAQYGGGPGWNWIKNNFLPRLLDEGFTQENIDNFMYHNPARFYSIRK